MAYIGYDDLPRLRKKYRDKKIVFCSGSFDLTHAGHVLFFEDAKKLGDVLVVGVGGDEIIGIQKGPARPILNQHLRMKMIDSLKPVDYCLLDDNRYHAYPLEFVEYVLSTLKPELYVVNNDAFEPERRRAFAEKSGAKLVVLDRWCPPEFDKISTTKLIEKIKKLGVE